MSAHLLLLIVVGTGPAPLSEVVYPLQDIPLNFDHRLHLLADDASCTDCHEAAEQSARTADRLLPIKDDTCAYCHDVEAPNECGLCHPAGSEPRLVKIPPARLTFPHRRHVAAGVECEECHKGVREATIAGREHLPSERDCVTCHESRGVSTRCSTCHLTAANGLLRTWFSNHGGMEGKPATSRPEAYAAQRIREDRLIPRGARGMNHDAHWHKSHGPVASANPRMCSNCHGQDECRACHGGDMRPVRLHPDDWVLTHPMAARGRDLECQSCHRLQTFCRDCHRRSKVVSRAEDERFSLPGSMSFHPEGWTSFPATRGGAGPNHHSHHARNDVSACASCHSEATCVRCHAADGFGPSPHPPGFSADCDRLFERNPTPCATCHGDAFRCP